MSEKTGKGEGVAMPREHIENLAITLAIIAVSLYAVLAIRAVRDCHRDGGRAVKNMIDWPVCILPTTEVSHAER